jgi:hypothetical protein
MSVQLPRTERVTEQVMSLPTGTGVDDGMVEEISDLVHLIVANASAIQARLSLEPTTVKHG